MNLKCLLPSLISAALLFGCSPAEKKDENTKVKKADHAKESYSPGTAEVKAEITQLDSSKGSNFATIKITEVIGYGSSTPPIAPDSELKVELKTLEKLRGYDKGSQIGLLLEFNQDAGNASSTKSWTVKRIKQ
jgi:hypothetical protein